MGDVIEVEDCKNYKNSIILPNPITQVASMANPLFLSLQGKYFVGYADNMEFESGNIAWAGLINPPNSGVNLFAFVWTVTNIGEAPLIARVWVNATPPSTPTKSEFVTPANTAIHPLPVPKVLLLQGNNALSEPEDGTNVYVREVNPEVTIASDENGRLIFPPGGSLIVTISYPKGTIGTGMGRVAFGWSEEKTNENRRCL
nr:DUF6143 family protein [Clostridium paridis]